MKYEHQDKNSSLFIATVLAIMSVMLFFFLKAEVKWLGFLFLAFSGYYAYQAIQENRS